MNGISQSFPTGDTLSLGRLAARDANAQDPQTLEAMGKEFESVFLSMLLKNMRTTVSGEGLFAGDSSDTFGSMFDLFMSQHLANTNSLGIGNVVKSYLANNQESNLEMP